MKEYQDILQQLQKNEYKPLYLLYGNEAYFIDKITDYITQNALSEAEKGFNQTIYYGKDVNAGIILETAKRYPMMSEKQVVIIREAQDLKDLDDLEAYAENPVQSTILVLAYKYKKPDGRKKVVKAFKKNGVLFESKAIYENQMQDWISSYVHYNKRKISPRAIMLISEFIGTNLSLASNEMDKLFITIPEGEMIDDGAVSRVIGINKEYNNFELTKALGARDYLKAMQIATFFSDSPKEHPFIVTISILAKFYTQLMLLHFSPQISHQEAAQKIGVNPYFVDQYFTAKSKINGASVAKSIEIIREYDLKSKGVGTGSGASKGLIKELVFKLLHV
jgi:DNA polymerase-3 subunit delta